jgi:transcriptional regulator with XRE-family HTH domain
MPCKLHVFPEGGDRLVGTPSFSPDPPGDTQRLKSPTALRVVLGTQLRRLREARGVTVAAAGQAIHGSGAKISRMELGRVGPRERDVMQLLTLYGVSTQQEREAFLTLVRRANVPGWWHQYSDIIPSWFDAYLGLEQASSVIRTYQPQLVPGLLQTPEVARTVIKLGYPRRSADDIERKVALRMTRQEILTQPDPPLLWAVFEEASLWRLDKNSVMREQIRHLISMAELPNVSIQLIPVYSRAHVGVGGPFTILRFPHADLSDIVYLEQLTSAVYLDKNEDVKLYTIAMNRLCTEATTPTQTITLLNDTLRKL